MVLRTAQLLVLNMPLMRQHEDTMTNRTRAWRRKQTRRVVAKIEDTKEWLLKTVQKRKADRPAPVPGAKEHKHGNLTKIQELRLQVYVNQQLLDETKAA